jgi:hypothetical protein
MPQDHRRRKEEFPLALRSQGHSYYTIADDIGWSFAHTRRQIVAALTNGNAPGEAPTTTLQRVEIAGEAVDAVDAPERINASAHSIALLKDHESRLVVLEAFMETLQRQPHLSALQRINASTHPTASEYIRADDFYSTGVQLSRARFEHLKVYAAAQRLEIREAMDMALAAFLAAVEGER